jgi:uncharacterized protein
VSLRRLAISATLVAGVALAVALPAAAHVTVNPNSATKGSYAKLTFRVPSERDVDTTKVAVKFDLDHPIASVSVKPKPGWTYEVTKETLPKPLEVHGTAITEGVSLITWSGGTIKPGEFDEFEVSGGPLPSDVDRLLFPTVQTYADGQDVSWIDPPSAAGDPEPEHPAPALTLTDAADDDAGHGTPTTGVDTGTVGTDAADTGSGSDSGATVTASQVSKSDVDGANSKGTIAIVVAGVALVAAVGGLVLGRRSHTG